MSTFQPADPAQPQSRRDQIRNAFAGIVLVAGLIGGIALRFVLAKDSDNDRPNPCRVDPRSEECSDFLDWMADNPG